MGHRQISKLVKMKLFAVLALAVASRQVNQFAKDVIIGGACTADGDDCGLLAECNADKKCACTDDNVPAADTINCEAAKVIADIGDACATDGAQCGNNAECKSDKCACKADFEAIKDDKKNCAAPAEGPALDAECTTDGPKCGGNQEGKASADDASKMTCQCLATHEDKEGVCTLLESDGSAAFYSVATAFMALILAYLMFPTFTVLLLLLPDQVFFLRSL